MATTIVRFFGGATLTSSLVDIYTCPASTTARIEHINVANGATAGTITIKIYDASANASTFLWNAHAIDANGVLEGGNYTLEAGDKIQASAATTTDAAITLFGATQS